MQKLRQDLNWGNGLPTRFEKELAVLFAREGGICEGIRASTEEEFAKNTKVVGPLFGCKGENATVFDKEISHFIKFGPMRFLHKERASCGNTAKLTGVRSRIRGYFNGLGCSHLFSAIISFPF